MNELETEREVEDKSREREQKKTETQRSFPLNNFIHCDLNSGSLHHDCKTPLYAGKE